MQGLEFEPRKKLNLVQK